MSDITKVNGTIDYTESGDIVADARRIIEGSQRAAHQAVNVALVRRNWQAHRRGGAAQRVETGTLWSKGDPATCEGTHQGIRERLYEN